MAGGELAGITDETYPEGLHQVRLNAANYSKGMYLLRFESDDGAHSDSRLIKIIAMPYLTNEN
jgi:hypothetical protein